MNGVSWTFHLRWFLWGCGGFFLFFGISGKWNQYRPILDRYFEKKYFQSLWIICGGFFGLALLGKYSQLWSLSLNSQDFWLFVDILENLKKGAAFLTHFAPQSLGVVQHGVVHPMFTWALLLPFAKVFGSVHAALFFGPLVLSAAAGLLGLLTRQRWGACGSILWVIAFLASTQLGRVLMYDVHPEAAYPFFVFLWLWSLGLDGTGKVRWSSLVCSTVGCVGIKEDSFLVLGPWLLWGLFALKGIQKKATILGVILTLSILGLQILAVKNWTEGKWGPAVWEGSWVVTHPTVGFLQGLHWSSFQNIVTIFKKTVLFQGGPWGWFLSLGTFLISRSWLSLLIFSPWVMGQKRFWWAILPLAGVYSLLGSPSFLWNYYSAPFLATFWFCASSPDCSGPPALRKIHWAVGAALLLGSGSVLIYGPSAQVAEIKNHLHALSSCILEGKGLVASHLIGEVPLDRVWTDRVPLDLTQWEKLDFVLFSPQIPRFELPFHDLILLQDQLKRMKNWTRVTTECQNSSDPTASPVILFLNKSPKKP